MSDVYITKFWDSTHPIIPRLKIIQERYIPRGTSKLYLAKNKSANPKLKQLKELIHKHYRFYNDGDSFRIGGFVAGYETRAIDRWGNPFIYKPQTDKALHLLEDRMEELTEQIWELTREERSRSVDQYGRVHRHTRNIPGYIDID